MLLAVAVRASGSISGERDKQTMDGLLTTPLDGHTILLAKWVGAILSVRWGWVWLERSGRWAWLPAGCKSSRCPWWSGPG